MVQAFDVFRPADAVKLLGELPDLAAEETRGQNSIAEIASAGHGPSTSTRKAAGHGSHSIIFSDAIALYGVQAIRPSAASGTPPACRPPHGRQPAATSMFS